jgi:hypothetical protein
MAVSDTDVRPVAPEHEGLDWRTASEDELLGPQAVALRDGQSPWLVAVAFLAFGIPIAGWLVFMLWPSPVRIAVAFGATAVAIGCFLTLWWSSRRVGRAASEHLSRRLGTRVRVHQAPLGALRSSIELQLEHAHSQRR